MNQILSTKLEKKVNQILSIDFNQNQDGSLELEQDEMNFPSYFSDSNSKKKNWFKFQFIFSILMVTLSFFGMELYFYSLKQQENLSNDLMANYNIYRLYSTSSNTPASQETFNSLFGIIEIPKINLYYPVFSHLTEDLLKIAPCKFYGETPAVDGNICIAGHNYDNSLFFSKISDLSVKDEISIFDNNGTQYLYVVYDIYEVTDSDLSPILNYEKNKKTLTLVTCNNFNSNRIILKAYQKQ